MTPPQPPKATEAPPSIEAAGEGGETGAGEDSKPQPFLPSLSNAVDPEGEGAALPGALGAPVALPDRLPPELDANLSQRERRVVWLMFGGAEWQKALTTAGYPARARLRDSPPPRHMKAALDYLMAETAHRCGASRKWILTQVVSLYRRATQAEPVLDRKGIPTGEYRMDGATAARCLEMLGNQAGMFGKKVTHDVPSDVRALMAAIAARGKPQLPAPGPRVVGASSAAPADRGSAAMAEKA